VADDEPVSWGEFFGTVAKAFGAPQPREVPRWVFRFMPYARAMMMGAHRLSNAKAKRELLWKPTAPTYREGISRLAEALGEEG
jgi:nucleoside-diphosphate-sugar epimerase